MFFREKVFITSGAYECSYNQRNYLVFWKSVLRVDVFITRFLYDVFITRVLITRVDCSEKQKELIDVLEKVQFFVFFSVF